VQQLLLAGPQMVNNHLLSGTTINTLKVQAERFTSKVAGRGARASSSAPFVFSTSRKLALTGPHLLQHSPCSEIMEWKPKSGIRLQAEIATYPKSGSWSQWEQAVANNSVVPDSW